MSSVGCFFAPFSAQGQSASIQRANTVAGVCILQMYPVPTETAEQNPSQILGEQLHRAAAPLQGLIPARLSSSAEHQPRGTQQPAWCC